MYRAHVASYDNTQVQCDREENQAQPSGSRDKQTEYRQTYEGQRGGCWENMTPFIRIEISNLSFAQPHKIAVRKRV
jgi:hypothetical protein